MHENHRERLRERLRQEGLDNFEEHVVLELLLFYSIPRADTNGIAHTLIKTFGSLEAVFEAPYDELLKVKGIGESSAALLTFIPQVTRRYVSAKAKTGVRLDRPEKLREYALAKYVGEKQELVYMLCLDGRGRLNNCCGLAEGSLTSASIDARHLLETALRNTASHIILMHNHPGGIAAPSSNDVEATKRVAALMASVDIRLVDHLIVAGQEVFSMAAARKFAGLFI